MGYTHKFGGGKVEFGGGDGISFSLGGRKGLLKGAAYAFYALTAALCLWLFIYISGLYPYLGTGRVQNSAGPGYQTDIGTMNLGLTTMFLFEGQTAFFEYDITSEKSRVVFDVKPVLTLGYTDRAHRISGAQKARSEFAIEKTGFYTFAHEPALGRGFVDTRYSVSWGAK